MAEWTDEEINKFKQFKALVQSRLDKDESEDSAFRGKPSGFSEWLREEYKKKGGIGFKEKTKPKTTCWKCGKEYPENYRKCPYCRSFNPDANKNE